MEMSIPRDARTRTWDIHGKQNVWNWKVSTDADEILYQTRFPCKHLAMMYRGAGESAQLLATIETGAHSWEASITFPQDDRIMAAPEPITMENISDEGMSTRWPVKVQALGGQELHWEYEHPAVGDRDLRLEDPLTKDELGNANSNFLSLSEKLPEAAVEELVITGTAAQIMLASLMHNDMTIAADGPEGHAQWKYQEPEWWENEGDEEQEATYEHHENETDELGESKGD
ncbi:uncharacterized protein LY89DRAFT_727257 [Mollisia scopiformis]|uniref:Uncharacterized protein n=1 Tax=Mollisia scopiformis TaxID=149040 RepID=A0A194XV69_MOLSC|nr:uncharacterized protein LY89DRAFT_727257 [Mollisia scopiformis]KUJ24225.1 hypothetical protein LY89DRAFT_727257 [Mollisia scopiformis]